MSLIRNGNAGLVTASFDAGASLSDALNLIGTCPVAFVMPSSVNGASESVTVLTQTV